jgi:hypothetical protein
MKRSDFDEMEDRGEKTLTEDYSDPGRKVREFRDPSAGKNYQVDEEESSIERLTIQATMDHGNH